MRTPRKSCGGWARSRVRRNATFLVHGEPVAQLALKDTIERQLGWAVHVPEYGESVEVGL